MRRAQNILAAAVGTCLCACAHPAPAPKMPSPSSEPIADNTPTDPPPSEGACGAKYDGQCYTTADEACAAAGCADRRCEVLESDPARVSCMDER